MVDLEELRARGLHAYEAARMRMAARVLLYLAPVLALCWWQATDRETCGCLAVLLAISAVWLRRRDRRGVEDVTTGLMAGAIPLGAGLLLAECLPACGGPFCVAISAVLGVVAGAWVAVREQRARAPQSSLFAASVIAALAAGLGCLALGVLGLAGVVVGVAVGSGLGAAASGQTR